MRTRAAVASVIASIAVLVTGWQLGAAGTLDQPQAVVTTSGAPAPSTAGSSPLSDTAVAPTASPDPSTATDPVAAGQSSATTTAADGTYTGDSQRTRYGNVQVQVTVSGGSITDVTALQLTDADGRSVAISNRAAPVLRAEVLAAQSAKVSTVSGATYTTEGYLSSLQSALDQAGL